MNENHIIKVNVDRELEKVFTIDRTERGIIIGEEAEFDTITPEQMLTWAIDTDNIPLRSRDGAIIRVEGGGNTYWGPDFIVDNLYSQIFWVIDNGNGTVSVTELVNYDKISEGFNSVTTGITEHLSAPKYQVNFKTSGAGATYVSFGMITTIAPTSTTTVVTMDTIYSGMIGQTLIVQNLKSSGNVTITLGANTLLNSVSNVLTPGQTLHLVAMENAVSLTDYQFAKIN